VKEHVLEAWCQALVPGKKNGAAEAKHLGCQIIRADSPNRAPMKIEKRDATTALEEGQTVNYVEVSLGNHRGIAQTRRFHDRSNLQRAFPPH
jgi:hypothetical protein